MPMSEFAIKEASKYSEVFINAWNKVAIEGLDEEAARLFSILTLVEFVREEESKRKCHQN